MTTSIFDILKDARCKVCQRRQIECEMFSPFHMMCEDCLQEENLRDKKPMFERCKNCEESRNENNFAAADKCRTCKGKGFKRSNSSYICNKCGNSLCFGHEDWISPHGLVDLAVSGGYHSEHLLDCTSYKFSLCEKCIREIFESCKIPPAVHGMGDYESYAEESASYKSMRWDRSTGPSEKYAQGICNASENCNNAADYRYYNGGNIYDKAYCSEHIKRYSNSSVKFIPAAAIAGVPGDDDKRTPEQNIHLANVIMEYFYPQNEAFFIRFIPSDVGVLIPTYDRQEGTSGIWIHDNVNPNEIPDEVKSLRDRLFWLDLPSGTLHYDAQETLYGEMLRLNHKEPLLSNDDHDWDKRQREAKNVD